MLEQWKLIEAHFLYEVSNLGRVRNILTGHILKNRGGGHLAQKYAMVLLNGRNLAVHRLVAHYYIGPRPPKMQVNHIDGDKMNPSVSNLEYVTQSQNVQHAYDNGLMTPKRGANNPSAKLTAEQVDKIRALYVPRKYGQSRLAREFGVTQAAIWYIVNGSTWR